MWFGWVHIMYGVPIIVREFVFVMKVSEGIVGFPIAGLLIHIYYDNIISR